MEPEWLAFLLEQNPKFYEHAKQDMQWAAEWRDKEINMLKEEGILMKSVIYSYAAYVKHLENPSEFPHPFVGYAHQASVDEAIKRLEKFRKGGIK